MPGLVLAVTASGISLCTSLEAPVHVGWKT